MDGANETKVNLAEELFSIYRQDHAAGILDARLKWRELDEDLLLITEGWANSAKLELDEVESITSLGIDGYEWAFFVEAQNTVSFHKVLQTIAQYNGELPAREPLKRHALDILSGRMNLQGAIRLVAADTPLLTALPQIFQTLLPGMDPKNYSSLEQAVRVAAASALPWHELLKLRGIAPEDAEGIASHQALKRGAEGEEGDGADEDRFESLRADYAKLMEKADDPALLENPRQEEELLLKALDVAVQSPEPDDDIETIEKILQLADRFNLSAYSVRRCVDAIHKLVTHGHHGVEVARSVVALTPLIAEQDIKKEMAPFLTETTSILLKTPLPKKIRQDITAVAVRAYLWKGDPQRADEVLAEALAKDEDGAGPLRHIEVALLKSNILLQEGDEYAASDVLLDALSKKGKLDGRTRLPLLRKLLSNWPSKRGVQEIRPVTLELIRACRSLQEPKRTMVLVKTSVRLHSRGQRESAMSLFGNVDYEKTRYTVPPPIAKKLYRVVQKAAETLGYPIREDDFDEDTVVKSPRPKAP